MTEISLPDGTIAEFPDSMSQADIEAVLVQQFGGGQPQLRDRSVVMSELQSAQPSGDISTIQSLMDEMSAIDSSLITEFPERRGDTRAVKELDELGSGGLLAGENQAKVAALSPILLATTNPKEMADILSASFPNIGISQDPGGNLLATNNNTGVSVVINKPGISKLDVIQGLGIISAFAGPAMLANAPAALAGKMAVGGIGAAATQAAIEGSQAATGGDFSKTDVALAGGLGAAAEGVFPAIQGMRNARQASKLSSVGQNIDDISQAVKVSAEASEKTKIPLFDAQKTLVPSQLERQSFVAQLPAGAMKASKALGEQNKAAANAVDDLLKSIAPDDAVVSGAGQFRSASQPAIEKLKNIRAEKASPLYKQAWQDGGSVDIAPVKQFIKSELDDLPESGEIAKTLKKINTLLDDSGAAAPIKKLHNVKLEIDTMLNKFGDSSLGNTTKSKVVELKDILLQQIDDASPSYKAARQAFSDASPQVVKMQDSIIGNVAGLEDGQLKDISRRIFDPSQTNPQIIKNAKAVIKDIDPNAWNALVRTELERRIGSVKPDVFTATNSVDNVPGQLSRAIFANKKNRDVLFNSVDGDIKQRLTYLEVALKRASLGRPGGSQTAAREEIKRELRGGFLTSVRDLLSSPIKTATSVGEDIAFDKRVSVLTDALFNPQWKSEAKMLMKHDPSSPAAARASAQLFKDIINSREK